MSLGLRLALAVGRRATSGNHLSTQDLIEYLNSPEWTGYQNWSGDTIEDNSPAPDQCFGEPSSDQWDCNNPGAPYVAVPASPDGPAFFLWEQTARRVVAAFVETVTVEEALAMSLDDWEPESLAKDRQRIESLEEALEDALSFISTCDTDDEGGRFANLEKVLAGGGQR